MSLFTGSNLRKNEILLSSSMVIKNDTQSELPNNRSRTQLPTPRVLAPPARRVSAHNTPLLPDVSGTLNVPLLILKCVLCIFNIFEFAACNLSHSQLLINNKSFYLFYEK